LKLRPHGIRRRKTPDSFSPPGAARFGRAARPRTARKRCVIVFSRFPSAHRDRCVLIIEGIDNERKVLAGGLRYFGLKNLILAGNGLEARKILETALEQAGGCPLDLVVTDLSMPGMGGLELIRFIRANPSLRDLPVIVVTGTATVETVEELSKLGIAGLLLKPISPGDLAELAYDVFQATATVRRDRLAG